MKGPSTFYVLYMNLSFPHSTVDKNSVRDIVAIEKKSLKFVNYQFEEN